jgi:hypothetical protein
MNPNSVKTYPELEYAAVEAQEEISASFSDAWLSLLEQLREMLEKKNKGMQRVQELLNRAKKSIL